MLIIGMHSSREAVQILGGIGYTRGGQGDRIERVFREVKAVAIPGGSEEIMLDLGVRQQIKVGFPGQSTSALRANR